MEWVQACFPRATCSLPEGAYARIRHPLGEGAAQDPYLSRLNQDALFVDLETLGFLGHPLFLIGLLHRPADSDRWEVLQLLARDYTEEEAVIGAFGGEGRRNRLWVSFNGKSFDLPFLRNRAAYYRTSIPVPEEHLDLLPLARRLYRRVLPDCRLQTLESNLFGRYRHKDLGGAEIPAAYHAFVRTGDPTDMGRILLHNRDDLVSLARLLVHLKDEE
jgi:uncharacterized protein